MRPKVPPDCWSLQSGRITGDVLGTPYRHSSACVASGEYGRSLRPYPWHPSPDVQNGPDAFIMDTVTPGWTTSRSAGQRQAEPVTFRLSAESFVWEGSDLVDIQYAGVDDSV